MDSYHVLNLLDLAEADGEEVTVRNLQNFYCPYNNDVEDFLRNKDMTFAKQRIATVWLVFASFKGSPVLVGYFALASKYFHIGSKAISRTLQKSISKFATFDENLRKYILPAPLIGQLGKNFQNDYNELITGNELLTLACDKVKEGQRIFGGRVVFVECEDTPKLVDFYQRNNFCETGRRKITREEATVFKSKTLIQFLEYVFTEIK